MVRGQWANLTRMPWLHPYSFGIFNDQRESGPRLNNIISNKGNYLALPVQSQVKFVFTLYS